jgi:hypothetical protein
MNAKLDNEIGPSVVEDFNTLLNNIGDASEHMSVSDTSTLYGENFHTAVADLVDKVKKLPYKSLFGNIESATLLCKELINVRYK